MPVDRPGSRLGFRPMIHGIELGTGCVASRSSTCPTISPIIRKLCRSHGTVPAPVVRDRQVPKQSPVRQRIMHKVHAPTLVGPVGHGAGPRSRAMCFRRRTRMRNCKPSRLPSSGALAIHQPTLKSACSQPRLSMSQLAITQPQGGMILRGAPSIPGGAAEER